MMPAPFSGDNKAFFSRAVTLGWLLRLRAWDKEKPLGDYAIGSYAERKVVPLMFQLTGRPLLDLVEDFFRGPQLFRQASRYLTADFVRESYLEFKRLLFDFEEDMSADFHQLIQWCSRKDLSFNRNAISFRSSFLQYGWDFHLVGRECSLACQTFHPGYFGVTRVVCDQVGGSWSPLGYVLTGEAMDALGAYLKTGFSVPPLTDTKALKVHICPKSIDLSSAVMAFRPWLNESGRGSARFMRRLEGRLCLDPMPRFEYYRELYEEFVFWHEYGHLHFSGLERDVCQAAIEAAYINLFYGTWVELLADAFAFERVLKNADEPRRRTMLALILDGCEPEELSYANLISARSLMEQSPGLYVYELAFEMIRKLQFAGRELERRARQVNMSPRNIFWAGWEKEQEKEVLVDFLEWQQTTLERALEELSEMMAGS